MNFGSVYKEHKTHHLSNQAVDWTTRSRVTLLFKLYSKRLSLFRPSNKLITLKTNSKRCKLLLLLRTWAYFQVKRVFLLLFFILFRRSEVKIGKSSLDHQSTVRRALWFSRIDSSLRWVRDWTCEIQLPCPLNMAEELQRAETNLKPSELKAAFKRSRDIDALLDEERELKEREVQLLILGKHASGLVNSSVAIFDLLLGE